MQKLFAFNISKEVTNVPALPFVYDPTEQVNQWIGDDKVVAGTQPYCTQSPYTRKNCAISGPFYPQNCTTYVYGGANYFDAICDW